MLISHFDMRLLQQWTLSDFIPGLICFLRCLALLLLQMMLQFFLTGWFNAGVKNTCAWKTEGQLLSWPTIRSFAAIVKIFHGPAKIFYKWIISTIMSWTLQVHGYWDPIDGINTNRQIPNDVDKNNKMSITHIFCENRARLAYFPQLCLFICLLKDLGSEHAKSHWRHLFIFSPLCVFKWDFGIYS